MGSTDKGTSGVSVTSAPVQGGVNVGGAINGQPYRYSEATPGMITSAAAPVLAAPMSYAAPVSGNDPYQQFPDLSQQLMSVLTPDVAAAMGDGSFAFEPTSPLIPDYTPSAYTFQADPTAYELGSNWWD